MREFTPFRHANLEARRTAEERHRTFPSLLDTVCAGDSTFRYGFGGIRATRRMMGAVTRATNDLEAFFGAQTPQATYPYVWVQCALNPIPDRQGKFEWVHEIYAGFEEKDVPLSAPIVFDHGKLICCDIHGLLVGRTPRYDSRGVDLVMKYPARVCLRTPAENNEVPLHDEDDTAPAPHF